MNKPLANMAATLLGTEAHSGAETEAVRTILQELQTQGWITNRHEWYFEPECREHKVVHLHNEEYGGAGTWLEINPETGEVTKL